MCSGAIKFVYLSCNELLIYTDSFLQSNERFHM